MSKSVSSVVLSLLVLSVTAWQLRAEEKGPLPRFVPFSADDDLDTGDERGAPVVNRPVEERESEGWKWPTLPRPKLPALPKPSLPRIPLPSWSKQASTPQPRPASARTVDEPSTWDKVSDGTKRFMSKTKTALMPWAEDEEENYRGNSGARRTAKSTARSTPKAEKKPFYSSWFQSEEDEDEKSIRTVNDYLALPRVTY